ncbi:MAG TPA: T9SS type A sorting domain-containing protein, partial [Saprospiraceae bacterium]|nr:T9SS type A sorting domain-containing protein [Saprospiraceae bacterium]
SVGVIEGKGNSASRVSYDFTDKDIALNGVYTYRLRQVDFDGRFEYSNLVNIEVSRKGVVKTAIYPNPSVSDVNLDIYAVEGAELKVDIYDNLGKLVIQGFIDEVMTANVKTSKIESGRLNEGVYYIVVNVDGELSTHKLIIIE